MRFFLPRPALLASCALGAVLMTAACGGDGDSEADEPGSEPSAEAPAAENPMPEPEYGDDETVQLPIGLVSPAGLSETAPIGADGRITTDSATAQWYGQSSPHQTEIARTETFGCGDTISVMRTVPMVTDDPAQTALEYLLAMEFVSYGDPELSNPLAISTDLTVDSVEVEDGVAVVSLTGEPLARDACETWRVAKQIETTARVATGAQSAEIRLGESTLNEHWGLDEAGPLEIAEVQQD